MKKKLAHFLAVGAALTLLAASASGASAAIRIVKIYYDSPGADNGSNASLNAEWIRIKNTGNSARQLNNWRIRDAAGHVYKFGSLSLPAGAAVKLHTGSGYDSYPHHLYWGQGNYVWNNVKDTAKLKRPNGTVADKCSYNNASASAKVC
ncbi:MAG: lamin tail domain-containing protein [Gaiellales bacterium]